MKTIHLVKLGKRDVCAFENKISARDFCKELFKIFGIKYTIHEIKLYI